MTKEEKNQRIASGLGWTELKLHPVIGWCGTTPEGGVWEAGGCIPDFYRDEAANALILEKAKFSVIPGKDSWTVGHQWMNGTVTMWANGYVKDADRKTCIAEAFLKLLSTPHASPTR